jgi:membrane-associated phospholipid phosphatase
MVSAPRPSSPPVRRITATKDEEDNAKEYGLPSSHTLNTFCLSGYWILCFSYICGVAAQVNFAGI